MFKPIAIYSVFVTIFRGVYFILARSQFICISYVLNICRTLGLEKYFFGAEEQVENPI
jgi:hypothetical protein